MGRYAESNSDTQATDSQKLNQNNSYASHKMKRYARSKEQLSPNMCRYFTSRVTALRSRPSSTVFGLRADRAVGPRSQQGSLACLQRTPPGFRLPQLLKTVI